MKLIIASDQCQWQCLHWQELNSTQLNITDVFPYLSTWNMGLFQGVYSTITLFSHLVVTVTEVREATESEGPIWSWNWQNSSCFIHVLWTVVTLEAVHYTCHITPVGYFTRHQQNLLKIMTSVKHQQPNVTSTSTCQTSTWVQQTKFYGTPENLHNFGNEYSNGSLFRGGKICYWNTELLYYFFSILKSPKKQSKRKKRKKKLPF